MASKDDKVGTEGNDKEGGSGTRGSLFGAGGRFKGGTDPIMEKFNESIGVDKRMWDQDLRGSIAYANALVKAGLLTEEEGTSMRLGLEAVRFEWNEGVFAIKPGDEDIHTANERRLTELIGAAVAGKLHTGRSRNDQVATDTRLWTVENCQKLRQELGQLLSAGCGLAEAHMGVVTAGYTHLQPAQPVRFGHWVMSHVAALRRDVERLDRVVEGAHVCPLGSGALAGHAFGIDRAALATELGFPRVTSNSIDATCDRDFVLEFVHWAVLLCVHLSQLAEDLIIQNLLGTVIIDDAYSTGSSLMPHKKNPDALELLRGKAGTVLGRSTGLAATLKGLPRAYNKDLQEDKTTLFDVHDTVVDCVAIATGVLATLTINEDKMAATLKPEMLATDLADYLVRRGVPFRESHHICGAVVRKAEETGTRIDQLTLEELKSIDERFDADVVEEVWDYEKSVERKDSIGGTSLASLRRQIDECRDFVRDHCT